MYELMTGRPPFQHQDPMVIFEHILRCKLPFPRDFDKDAKSLIRHLTDHDLSKRYGGLKNGVENIRQHRFFGKNFDWQ